jgi:hypothetical protein
MDFKSKKKKKKTKNFALSFSPADPFPLTHIGHSFLETFYEERESISETSQGKLVINFIESQKMEIATKFKMDPDVIMECLEQYMMTKLYVWYKHTFFFWSYCSLSLSPRAFSPTKEHVEKDILLHQRIESLNFVTPGHLVAMPFFFFGPNFSLFFVFFFFVSLKDIPPKYVSEAVFEQSKEGNSPHSLSC